MKLDEMYPSKWMKAVDVPRPILAAIRNVTIEQIADDEDKPVLYFTNGLKPLILNRTNSGTIAAIYGDETDAWNGKPIVLFTTKVPFQGRMVDAIRLRAPKQQPVQPAPAAPVPDQVQTNAIPDDVPF